MSDPATPLDDAARVRMRAGEWLVAKSAAKAWSKEDQAALDTWLNESPAHLLAYWRLESAWTSAGRLMALRRPMRDEVGERKAGRRNRLALFAAAIVALAVGGSYAVYIREPAVKSYSTAIGGHETLKLTDGSTIELTTDTAIRVAVGQARHVWLDRGEAYFQVVHDPARPFVLQIGDQRVVDLGTEFSARRNGDLVKVAVVEGSVLVESTASDLRYVPVTLTAGQAATATPRSIRRETPTVKAIEQQLSWRRDLLVFDDTPLAEVAERFNRYNGKKLVIADESIAKLKVGGAFPTTGVESFARVAQHILKLHVEDRGDRTVLSR